MSILKFQEALRPIVTINAQSFMQKQINSYPAPKVNPLIFKKTPTERSLLSSMKKEINSQIREKFGTKKVGNVKFTRGAKLSII